MCFITKLNIHISSLEMLKVWSIQRHSMLFVDKLNVFNTQFLDISRGTCNK